MGGGAYRSRQRDFSFRAKPAGVRSASGTLVEVDAIRRMDERGLRRIDVRHEVMASYNGELCEDLAKSVWAADSQSWYKLADDTITNNWPHSTMRHRRLLRTAALGTYETAGR